MRSREVLADKVVYLDARGFYFQNKVMMDFIVSQMETVGRVRCRVMQARIHRQWLHWTTNTISLRESSTMQQYKRALPLMQWKEYQVRIFGFPQWCNQRIQSCGV